MLIKDIVEEDFINYKLCSMFILFPNCTFKCEQECGKKICQNSPLTTAPSIDISPRDIVLRYINNPITKAIVFGGLEPFDSFEDMIELIDEFRKVTDDNIIIYSGYTEPEIYQKINQLEQYKNIYIKFGRYIPDDISRYDEILGVTLASSNQYCERIS